MKLARPLVIATISLLLLGACDSATETSSKQEDIKVSEPLQKNESDAASQQKPMLLVPWEEGKHYNILDKDVTEEAVVVEYFSFWCPACYNFEPLAKEIGRQLDSNVSFQKVHVNFMGLASQESQELATLAMSVARKMGNEELVNASIFSRIHQERKNITSIDDIKEIFASLGISPNDFDKEANSPEVQSIFETNNNLIVSNREALSGVPNFIVNGKYQAKFTRDMNAQDVIELIKWLSKQD